MDCNKEEASRAKALAENSMQRGDFPKAQKLLMKAQRLFSGLDSLPQMLAVCDVHCAAVNKINGLENWYGILQVMHFSDDAMIKKQYRNLALLLHPDKNQFPGAESAFKLVGEANRLLADKVKRSQYDIKSRINSQVASRQLNGNSASGSSVKRATFWTCCEHCGFRYKYLEQYVNSNMYCSKCQRSFMAYDTGLNGVPPKPCTSQKEVQDQGPCNTPVSNNGESNGVQPESVAAEVDRKESAKEKFNEKNGGSEKNNEVRKPKTEDGSMRNDTESMKPEEGEGKMNKTADLPKADGLKPQPKVTEPEKIASKSIPDESVSRSSQASSVTKGKRKRREIVEDLPEDKADSKDANRRTSPRNRQHISCGEKGRSDGPPTKRSRSNVGLKSERGTKKQKLGVGSSKPLDSGGSPAPSCVSNGKSSKRVDSVYQESLSTEDKKSEGNKEHGEGMGIAGKIDNNHKPVTQDSPDPDFHNFEVATSCFAVNQVWSLYDPSDGMPRFYARIKKVMDAEFKVCITWLDPLEDNNNDNSVPIACGVFQERESEEVDDHLIFSCQMLHVPGDNNTVLYPRRGEVWAVFRGWDSSWIGSSENHKGTYEYDFVEVLCDFDDVDGLRVAYLGKVEGFVSLFQRDVMYGVLQLHILPKEMLRFSHKVPSFKLTGSEREGVPPGCFELDTAALPKEMFEVAYSEAYVGLDGERPNGKIGGSIPEVPKVEVQARKRQKFNGNHDMKSVKKSKKNVKAVDGLNLRKSSRVLSETNNQATSSPSQEAEKKSANHDVFCFSVENETMTTPKKPAKVVTAADSSRIRKTHKSTGNPTKRGRNDESLSQARGNGLLNGAEKSSVSETHGPSSCTTRQANTYNFENKRSKDKFQVDQIWAIYSITDKGMPRKYGQVKRIDTSPEFKLHVAPLELCRPPNLMTHPLCCGTFKLKTGKADVLEPSSFSHQIKAVKKGINRYEVYPGKGEIWALYKNWNTTDCAETEEELEMVEVVETNEQRTQVVVLTAKVCNKLLYSRCVETVAGSVDIPKTEVNRFSHQVPAFRRERCGDYEWWELDSKALVDL